MLFRILGFTSAALFFISLVSIGCTYRELSESEQAEAEESFRIATGVNLSLSPSLIISFATGSTPEEYDRLDMRLESINRDNPVELLFDFMQDSAVSVKSLRAVESLRSAEVAVVRFIAETTGGYNTYDVSLIDKSGKTLNWRVRADGWTFRNDAARRWLHDNDFRSMCRILKRGGYGLSPKVGLPYEYANYLEEVGNKYDEALGF